MKFAAGRTLCRIFALLAVSASLSLAAHAQFTEPTKEELQMTSLPEVPGAPALYLNREEITEDGLHMYARYERIKVLTEAGKKYADVELMFYNDRDTTNANVTDIQGRTIHPDGKVIPFTGKPYEKVLVKRNGSKYAAKVFTLPDVEVGSIIEYRYKFRYDDGYVIPARWDIQTDLFIRKGHYLWKPVDRDLVGPDGRFANYISWSALLPKGADVVKTDFPAATGAIEARRSYDLKIQNVAPMPEDSYMPPIHNLGYRVWFYYSPDSGPLAFWQNVGKAWAKNTDKFINSDALTDAASSLVAVSDTPDQKLHKIYAAVMGLENTDFTRERTDSEDKASTGHGIRNASDVWQAKRGSSDALAMLFIALARAAHLKAYAMEVTDRSRGLFLPDFMSLNQLDDYIAIVNVDGKDQFFDPGARYCPYGHLAWQHTYTHGLRQMEDGSASIMQGTPGETYQASVTARIADLVLDKDGGVSGPITVTYSGSPALEWRERALRTDDTGIRAQLKDSLQEILPAGLEVQVASIAKLTDYEDKLTVTYTAKGTLGSITGKRIILPADPFEVTAKATFPQDKRSTPVYFHYPYHNQMAYRIRFPQGFAIESAPPVFKDQYQKSAANSLTSDVTPTSITVHRDIISADTLVPVEEYTALRTYYNKMEQAAQSNIVLALPAAPGGN